MHDTFILIVEDSASQARLLQLLLTRTGYCVWLARDGADGWRLAQTLQPGLLLLDVNLPHMDGFEVLHRIKRTPETAHIPVVMLTNHDSVHDVERALSAGADGYLFKEDCLLRQEGMRQIVDVVAEYIQGTAEHSSSAAAV